jgi:hypothetical protein
MWLLTALLAVNFLATASACFVTTENMANLNKDLDKRRVKSAEECWNACENNSICVQADFRQRTGDCWLKSDLSSLQKRVGIDSLKACSSVYGATGIGLLAPMDRIAVSADGNFRDEDDIGASPMTFALLVAADTTDRLVYYGYRSHIWNPESSRALKRFNGRTQDQRMKAAISEGVGVYGLDKDVFKDEKAYYDASGQEAQPELVSAINASSKSSRLWIIGAGPMQTIYKSLQAADLDKLEYVTLISHSISNNKHAEGHKGGVRWEDVKSLLINNGGQIHFGGRTCSGCISPTVAKPRDQNALLDFRKASDPLKVWTWLRDSSDKRENFVFDKIKDSNVGDVSDAGMMYYLLTGDENADPVKLRAFLSQERKSVPIETVDKRGDTTVADFVHRPAVFASTKLKFAFISVDASKMTRWQDCVQACIEQYGAKCLYVQFDRLTPSGTCIISQPCSSSAKCSKVSDVNKRGRDYNRVNCKRSEYVTVQKQVDSGVSACNNVF